MFQPHNGSARLRDVEEKRLAIPKTGKIVFFSPHTSERCATLPLISDLSDMLAYNGVKTEAHAVEDMGSQILSISSKLSRLRLSRKESDALDGLFRLKDVFLRLRMVCGILASDKQSVLLEIHALDRDYGLDDQFGFAEWFYRIPGTRVLHMKDYLSEYSGPLDTWIPRLLSAAKEGSRSLRAAVDILALDADRLIFEAPGMLRTLGENTHRSAMIEIPAPSEKNDGAFGDRTAFERTYGFDLSLRHRMSREEILAIVKNLL